MAMDDGCRGLEDGWYFWLTSFRHEFNYWRCSCMEKRSLIFSGSC